MLALHHLICPFDLFIYFVASFRAAPMHMEVPRLEIDLELQLLAYATAIAMQDLSPVFNLHHSSWQHQSLTH